VIIGIGLDLASIDLSTSVLEGTFTERELADAATGPTPQAHRLAARFAAKEAFIKSLGGSRKGNAPLTPRLDPQLVEVILDDFGRPALRLHGEAREIADALGVRHIWVSLSHEEQMAAATVILEG
jgi:holo-[acyl-carrier protein] synthase